MSKRDDFSEKTKLQLAKRAGWLCSFPTCRTPTVGAAADGESEINIGVACHICAAAPGGPRYDSKMLPEERSSANNGIWMCSVHAKAIDSDAAQFTTERLREWRRQAQVDSMQRVLRGGPVLPSTLPSNEGLVERFRRAVETDLNVFRNTAKWPDSDVELSLSVDGHDELGAPSSLANATSIEDLIVTAPPGMGKTTTLLQIAQSAIDNESALPIVVALGDWATETVPILASILVRPSFKELSEADFRATALHGGVLLLLDGWNELDGPARMRARVQIERLKAELPAIRLVISTRKQALDVPLEGKLVELLPLNEHQQSQIAKQIRGDEGLAIVDQAWRTPGIRELVTIPLYLTALLSLPQSVPFPTTKEEVLRMFVNVHEHDARRAEVLRGVTLGFQQDFLDGLAVTATQAANTAMADDTSRRSIAKTASTLIEGGQIVTKPEPAVVLDILVSNHVLMRSGDTPGVSFQHQQFQEWYASHEVETRILVDVYDEVRCQSFKAEVLNFPAWEEAILFAIERMSRGSDSQRDASSHAILAAFDVDPMLAAEMIYRATDEVWSLISESVQQKVGQWHRRGKVDRAFRFMMVSGRPEFLNEVWPLITDENNQVSLKALRCCPRFRPSLLGRNPEELIKALKPEQREVLLHEIASRSGMDGLDLAATIAKDETDQKVRTGVVDALAFRRADRHVIEVLQNANDAVFDRMATSNLLDDIDDESLKKRLNSARLRQSKNGASTYDRLRTICYSNGEDWSTELISIICEMDVGKGQDAVLRLVYEAHQRYPEAVAEGLLLRVRAGKELFYGADDLLASANYQIEDSGLLKMALAESSRRDDQAEAAASVLGPSAVGKLIDAYSEIEARLRDNSGKYDKAASDRYVVIRSRIAHVPGSSLVAAVRERSEHADNKLMAMLAELLFRHPHDEADRGRPFSNNDLAAIRALVEDWGQRMLASSDAERSQLAKIATLATVAPDASLLPLLKELLDRELSRYRALNQEAAAIGWQSGPVADQARWVMTNEYQHAFNAIKAPETTAVMGEYLTDEHFGVLAAGVLVSQWTDANEPVPARRLLGGVDFSRVAEKRLSLAAFPTETTGEAEMIFAAIETLIAEGTHDVQQNLAIALAARAARLPHGQRPELIGKLIAMSARGGRSFLLLNLILSGEDVDSKFVVEGFHQTLEAGRKNTWMLTEREGHEISDWLRLLPFTTRPRDALEVIRQLPPDLQRPEFREQMIEGLAITPSPGGEDTLFVMAGEDPRLYQNRAWRDAVLKLRTESSARKLIDLILKGTLPGRSRDAWMWSRELGALLREFPNLRRYVYGLLKSGQASDGLAMLARAVSENPDAEGLLLLIEFGAKSKRFFFDWPAIEKVVTEHIPVENWNGAYNVVPAPAAELRRRLLAITTDGGRTDAASQCLTAIDSIRDEYGIPMSDPRHPDLVSGRPWPILRSDMGSEEDALAVQ